MPNSPVQADGEAMPTRSISTPSLASRKLLDITDMINTVKYLNNALFMACSDVGDLAKTNALQSVCDEIESRIGIITDRIEDLRETLP